MSQGTPENMHEVVTKKKKRVHVLPETAIDAGLQALQRLSEAPAPAIKLTARALITTWLPQIIAEQSRGSSLLRIYNDLRKATKLRISYRSFQNYVSKASQEAGLRPGKAKAEPGLRPGPGSEAKPAWACTECESKATRTEKDGRAWWHCPNCKTFYADDDGKLSMKRLAKKENGNGTTDRSPGGSLLQERPAGGTGTPEGSDQGGNAAVA